ncbi:EamA-like transporter family protein [Enhygromyxa salina]|uniref:EamA-like transporter family protein n=1 Tax=Enhygromyxa salina TaxID=215803 RepID=A0A2S9YJX5_9BACT|nr:DMT family transporter [Enhygromyxa salina]PRQ05342.1 EamA-like transporter family protein [Enhygromyxa salina]
MSAAAVAIACGLGTALCFGTGDYLAQRVTRRHGWLAAVFGVQVAAAAILAVVALAWHGLPSAAPTTYATVAVIGVVNTLGVVGLFRAFEGGKLSLVSPIAGSMGAFSLGFAWLAGHAPPRLVVPGVVAVVVGIMCASVVVADRVADQGNESETRASPRAPTKLRRASGVGWALLSAVGFGWVFFMLGPSSELLGPAWVVFGLRLVAVAALLMLARAQRVSLPEQLGELREHSLGRLLAVATLDAGGMLSFAYGTSRGVVAGEIAVVAVLASSFPVVTIALACVRLREGLRWWQWLGVGGVVAGIAWISAWS